MYDLSGFSKQFPIEWGTIEQRKRKSSYYRYKHNMKVPWIVGGIPHVEGVSAEYLFYIGLESMDKLIIECEKYGVVGCVQKLKNVKEAYGKEISTLIGEWSDDSLRYIAELGEGDSTKRLHALEGMRKSNLAYYF